MTTEIKRGTGFSVRNLGRGAAEVMVYDEIGGPGVAAAEFVRAIDSLDARTIDVRLNSPGGDSFEAIAMYYALKRHPAKITVHIDGIAASSASFIALGGDRVVMARNAQMMIHEAQGVCAGDSRDMNACANILDACSDNMADIFAEKAGGTVEQWRARMREETWYTAEEAKKAGLIDEVSNPVRARNAWDLSVFNYAGRAHAPAPDLSRGDRIMGQSVARVQRVYRAWAEPLEDRALKGDQAALDRLRYAQDAVNAAAGAAGLSLPDRPRRFGMGARQPALPPDEFAHVWAPIRAGIEAAFNTPEGQRVLELIRQAWRNRK